MSAKVRMPSLVNTMSTCRQKELNVVEGNTCNCFHPTWKPAYQAMVAKVSRITSWVLVCSLPWAQHKRWIPIGLMGCVHTNQGMPAIEGWGNPSYVWSVVQKTKENNPKVGKIGWVINQMPTPRLKHDKIQAQWALNVPLESMFEKVWWCKHSEMEYWSWTICCSMSCSNERRHARATNGKKSQAILRCCWKRNVLSTRVKASRRKGCWSTINLTTMIETKAQFPK